MQGGVVYLIAFFGCVVPDSLVLKWKGTSAASNRFQKILLSYLDDQKVNIHSVVSNCHQELFLLESGAIVHANICLHGIVGRILVLFRTLRDVVLESRQCDIVVQFNPEYYSILTPIIAHFFGERAIIVLSDFTGVSERGSLSRKFLSIVEAYSIKKYDKAIVLSNAKPMKDFQKILVYRGAIDTSEFKEVTINKDFHRTIILYSGTYTEVSGIRLMLKAFEILCRRSDVELHLTGAGELESLVDDYSRRDRRIVNHGFVSRSELIRIYSASHLVVNPRDMRFRQNSNNFPSKILEYLCTGRPIVTTRFSGIDDFEDALMFVSASDETEFSEILNVAVEKLPIIIDEAFTKNREIARRFDISNQREKVRKFILRSGDDLQ